MARSHYITSPVILPILPETVQTSRGDVVKTRDALPIARAVLLEAVRALKQIPGGATRTKYSLERALYHLQRVKVERS